MNHPYRHVPRASRRAQLPARYSTLAVTLLLAQLVVCGAVQLFVARALTPEPPLPLPRAIFAPTPLPCVETTRWIHAYDRDYACPPGSTMALYAHEDPRDTWQALCECPALHDGSAQ